jgi:glutamate-5-semialdehyde dehydrogenase
MSVQDILRRAKNAAPALARSSEHTKNQALAAIADELEQRASEVLTANEIDMKNSEGKLPTGMLDRLKLNDSPIQLERSLRKRRSLTVFTCRRFLCQLV